MDKRYQNCKWPERLWRRRHYLAIPYVALRIWWQELWAPPRLIPVIEEDLEVGLVPAPRLGARWSWGLATGIAQAKMNWLYTLDEVKASFEQ